MCVPLVPDDVAPSPQSIAVVCVSRTPASVNVAFTDTSEPSFAVWSAPASTTGAAFVTVTRTMSQPMPPSSSVTQTRTS